MSVSISKVILGYMSTNCYLVKDNETGRALFVDPATYDDDLVALLKEENVTELDYILLTHGHFDHILGAKELQENYDGKIVIHSVDEECFTNGEKSLLSEMFLPGDPPEKADITVNDGDNLDFGSTQIKVMHTPGHTQGSVCYIIDDTILSGDTLFAGSVGRTDFPSGSMDQMKQSIKKLAQLDEHYKVLPGHGEATTLDFEKNNNVYFS